MKILSASQIKKADAYTIKNEPIASIDLMERAAQGCVDWLFNHCSSTQKIAVFCGPGNNGGDGLAISRMLIHLNYSVTCYVVSESNVQSVDFETNYKRLEKITKVHHVTNESQIDFSLEGFLVIDALFGSGINRPLAGIYEKVIQHINASQAEVIAVDMPSGLPCDEAPKGDSKGIIRANYTLTFEQPKLALLLAQNDLFVGKWVVIPIHLHPDFIDNEPSDYYLLEKGLIKSLVKQRTKFSHKGNYGHALICAGSYGKIGAAVLASKSCLRSGAGLVTINTPKIGYNIVQQSVPEAMAIVDDNENELSNFKEAVSLFNAVGVGPGIGTSEQTKGFLKQLLAQINNPMVLDADALNCIALDDSLRALIPQNSILTPHPKEFLRLVHAQQQLSDYDKIELQRQFSIENKCIVVLKGAHTTISNPKGQVYFNTTGNAGMATGGSGDVLTGLLTGLLAQGYEPFDAARIGVFLHGLAGDLAAEIQGQQALIASDIIEKFGAAFLNIQKS